MNAYETLEAVAFRSRFRKVHARFLWKAFLDITGLDWYSTSKSDLADAWATRNRSHCYESLRGVTLDQINDKVIIAISESLQRSLNKDKSQ